MRAATLGGRPGELDLARVVAQRDRGRPGVAVQPLSDPRLRPGPPGLGIGYAATTPDRLRDGVRLLATALR